MIMTLLIFVVLLAFIFLGFPIFMALLITGLIFLLTGGNSLDLAILKMFGSVTLCLCWQSPSLLLPVTLL